ncbi:MAG: transporter [Deltaproteobacteria bacterium]|nr:transporter [Deltaproteobacteria bacterium]
MVRKTLWLILAMVLAFHGTLALPAAAQGVGGPLLEKPTAAEEKKEEAPQTCGPIISDSCLPIEEHHFSMQVLGALSFYQSAFSPNWRYTTLHANQYTFFMPVKFTYGPTKNVETYIVVPYVLDWNNSVSPGHAGPNGERSASYGGIGDITAVIKYNFHPEGEICPAMTAVGGIGVPTGHANHLNPRFLGQDAIGTGSVNFITGLNLYKWVKPFLLYSNIWLNSPINIYPLRAADTPQAVRNHENIIFNLSAEYPLSKRFTLLLEMYSNWTWENINPPQSLGFQSPTTLLGVLPGIEFFATEKWALSTGVSFDLVGKYGARKYTPIVSATYNF